MGKIRSKSICILPWIGLNIATNGDVAPCCSLKPSFFGNSKKNSLEEILNGTDLAALRKEMLSGKKPDVCRSCTRSEGLSLESYRESSNRSFERHEHLIQENTNPDGSLKKLEIRFLNIRFSNHCNFKCRMCGHPSSSSWAADAVKLGWIKEKPAPDEGESFQNFDDFVRYMGQYLDTIEVFNFAGGEPLLIRENYEALEYLIERKKFNVQLRYNTNLSQLSSAGRDMLALWKKFPNVHVFASLDGAGQQAEYIRKGTKWDDIEANYKRLKQECPHVNFFVSTTLQVLNCLHVPDFHQDWISRGLVNPNQIAIRCLVFPPCLDVRILPYSQRIEIAERWKRHIEFLFQHGASAPTLRQVTGVIRHILDQTEVSATLDVLRGYLRKLDLIRGESFSETFPELAKIIDPR